MTWLNKIRPILMGCVLRTAERVINYADPPTASEVVKYISLCVLAGILFGDPICR